MGEWLPPQPAWVFRTGQLAAAPAAEVVRLRAELDRHRVAGDAAAELREEAFREIQAGYQVALNAGASVDSLQPLRSALGALNKIRIALRSVRGDAPAAPVSESIGHTDTAPADEPKPWHGGPTHSDPETVSEGWDEQTAQPVSDSVGWDLTFGARVTIGRDRERDEETGAPLPAAWTFHLSLFDRDGAAPCTAALTKDVTPEQVRSYGEQLIALAGAPAGDSAAPDGPTADEAVASAARIVEAWAHLRMDTPEDQATHDELVRVSRATIAAYVRTRPWSSAGQPVRDSQPEATAAPAPTTVTPAGYGTWVGEDWVVEQRAGGRVSVSESDHRDPPGHQSYEFEPEIARAIGAAAARPVRDGGGGESGE